MSWKKVCVIGDHKYFSQLVTCEQNPNREYLCRLTVFGNYVDFLQYRLGGDIFILASIFLMRCYTPYVEEFFQTDLDLLICLSTGEDPEFLNDWKQSVLRNTPGTEIKTINCPGFQKSLNGPEVGSGVLRGKLDLAATEFTNILVQKFAPGRENSLICTDEDLKCPFFEGFDSSLFDCKISGIGPLVKSLPYVTHYLDYLDSDKEQGTKSCDRCGDFLATLDWEIEEKPICKSCATAFVMNLRKLSESSLLFNPVFAIVAFVLMVFLSQWFRSLVSVNCNDNVLLSLWLLTAPLFFIPVYYSEEFMDFRTYTSDEIPAPDYLDQEFQLGKYKKALIMPVNLAVTGAAFAMLFPLSSPIPIYYCRFASRLISQSEWPELSSFEEHLTVARIALLLCGLRDFTWLSYAAMSSLS